MNHIERRRTNIDRQFFLLETLLIVHTCVHYSTMLINEFICLFQFLFVSRGINVAIFTIDSQTHHLKFYVIAAANNCANQQL